MIDRTGQVFSNGSTWLVVIDQTQPNYPTRHPLVFFFDDGTHEEGSLPEDRLAEDEELGWRIS